MSLKNYCNYLEEAISQFNSEYPFSLAIRSRSKNISAFAKLFFSQQGFDVVCLHNIVPDSQEMSYDWKTASEKEVQGMLNHLPGILQTLDNPLVIIDNYEVIYGEHDEGVRTLLSKGLIANTETIYQPYEANSHLELHRYAPIVLTSNSMFYDNVRNHTYDKTFTQMDYLMVDENLAVQKMAEKEKNNMMASESAYHDFKRNNREALEDMIIHNEDSRRLIRMMELHKYQLKENDYQLDVSMLKKTGFGLKA
jgi:hypothetical protein